MADQVAKPTMLPFQPVTKTLHLSTRGTSFSMAMIPLLPRAGVSLLSQLLTPIPGTIAPVTVAISDANPAGTLGLRR